MAEVRVLEYWRKKYLRQAVIVGILASVCAVSGVAFATYFWVKVLAVCSGVVFFYVMFKAIRDDFQARFEGALLMRGKDDLVFDIGRGSGENALAAQSVCPAYSVYECFNVIKGAGFSFEEVQLLEDVRFLGVRWPVFDGVIVRICTAAELNLVSGAVRLVNEKFLLEGATAPLLRDVKGDILSLLKHFGVTEAWVCVYGGAVYFWLNGAKKLYLQTKLFSYNEPSLFEQRIEALQATGRALAGRLS
ncbi:MAG: hypothetical protein J6C85_04630 [Alphaproteobacteria bacterium]|nr:hypothetical protein [Alphaproteobacteria bacterium]